MNIMWKIIARPGMPTKVGDYLFNSGLDPAIQIYEECENWVKVNAKA